MELPLLEGGMQMLGPLKGVHEGDCRACAAHSRSSSSLSLCRSCSRVRPYTGLLACSRGQMVASSASSMSSALRAFIC